MYLQLNDLNKSFDKKQVVKDLNLELEQGKILCLLGSSGCGKTTTLRMISGLLTPDSGRIIVDGEDITRMEPEYRPVSTVFQSYSLFPNMTVLQNVTYGLRLQKKNGSRSVRRSEIKAKGMEFLEMAGLTEYADARIWEISGGQQQRVALMRSLILQPKVLLLDEPLSNLDAGLREKMRAEIREVQRRSGTTMVFVTHDREEAMVISDQIAIMEQGRILQHGTPEELYEHPVDDFVMNFLGVSNRLTDTAGTTVYVRPEQLVFDPDGPLEGRITESEFLGFYRSYMVDTEQGTLKVIGPADVIHETGSLVRLSVNK